MNLPRTKELFLQTRSKWQCVGFEGTCSDTLYFSNNDIILIAFCNENTRALWRGGEIDSNIQNVLNTPQVDLALHPSEVDKIRTSLVLESRQWGSATH